MASSADFQSVRVKVARAREHLKALNQAIGDFRQSKPYAVVDEIKSETGEQIWKVRGPIAPPPVDRLSPLIGDTLYNFRSALDHLAWQLVLANGQKPTPKRTAFPICVDPVVYQGDAPRKLAGMDPRAVAAIKDAQPCYGPNPHRNEVLWGLETLCNIDKHRHFNLLTVSTHSALWSPGLPVRLDIEVHIGPVDDGTVLATIPKGYAQVNFGSMPDVAFAEAEVTGTLKSVDLLMNAIDYIVPEMIERFERDFC